MTLVITACTIGIYEYVAFLAHLAKPAAPFLILPAVSLAALIIVLGASSLTTRTSA